MLIEFIKKRPDIVEDQHKLDCIAQGKGRRFLDRNPKNLFEKSPVLGEGRDLHYIELPAGWYAIINLAESAKLHVLQPFAEMAGFREGTDWSWKSLGPQTPEKRTRKPIPSKLIDLRLGKTLDLESI